MSSLIFRGRALTLALFSLLLTGLLLTACGEETPTTATNQTPPTTSQANNQLPTAASPTTAAGSTTTTAAIATQAGATSNSGNSAPATTGSNPATGSGAGQPVAGIDAAQFIDNRSDALSLLASFYNAINRKEYVRAYSYWQNPGANKAGVPQSYDLFAQGYAKTASVQLTTGTIKSDAGAGQRYYNVPVTIQAKNTDGTSQTFVGCYTTHQAVAANFGAPPFEPLGIASAKVQPAATNANIGQLMSQVCQQGSTGPAQPTAIPNSDTAVGATYYMDDRSTASEALRSFYNAINRKEYVRAYYYWENQGTGPTSQPPDYTDFAKGYADTTSVELTTGQAQTEGAAGTIYYKVPVALKATHSDGKTQTFVGCYTLKQPQPANFGAPPFQPMSISAGSLKVSAGSPAVAPANQVCQ